MADDITTPHFEFPLRFGTKARVVEQDSDEEVTQTAAMVLRYEIGERTALPDYGIREQALHMNGPDLVEIRGAIEQWDDRAAATLTSEKDLVDLAYEVTVEINREA